MSDLLEYHVILTDRPDLTGAYCDTCRGKYDCRICPDRPFGSAPCTDAEIPQDCGDCPNELICGEIAAREWPLAELALKMAGVL